jgi:hypothetical protein
MRTDRRPALALVLWFNDQGHFRTDAPSADDRGISDRGSLASNPRSQEQPTRRPVDRECRASTQGGPAGARSFEDVDDEYARAQSTPDLRRDCAFYVGVPGCERAKRSPAESVRRFTRRPSGEAGKPRPRALSPPPRPARIEPVGNASPARNDVILSPPYDILRPWRCTRFATSSPWREASISPAPRKNETSRNRH